ncbi:MAG: DUF4435 domain-containing protein [Prevotellaceae bacterium]|jgi:hypothetical protein|nr:DUF4435 domain-containing protein [Prevotellaceae bacterium]
MQRRDYYRKWAMFYAKEAALEKIDAVIFVEGETDKPFWEKIFRHARKQVRTISGCNTDTKTGGKQECLKYSGFLSKRFFICIDSDYDYILQSQPTHCVQNFILQTYAYAIENHYLAANAGLQDFLKKYSAIIYPAFSAHLANGNRIAEFNRKFNDDIAFANRQDATLDALQKNIRVKYPSGTVAVSATAAGLTVDNTYLFIPAKTLKHKLQCGDNLSFSHFPMNKIMEDIATLFAN